MGLLGLGGGREGSTNSWAVHLPIAGIADVGGGQELNGKQHGQGFRDQGP